MMNGKRQGAARARTKGAAAVVAVSAAVAAWTSTARADFLTVFAGPGINPVGGSYQAPNFGDPLGAAVNDAGTAVVSVHRYTNPGVQDAGERGMRWDGSGAPPAELGNLGTGSNSFTNTNAYAINRDGVSVGYATVFGAGGANHGWRAVRWDAAGNPTQLDALGTDANGVGTGVGLAVNATGTAVGFAASYTNLNNATGSRAVRWNGTGTTATVLGDIGVDAGGSTFARAYAVNDAGVSAGKANKYNGSGTFLGERAVRWDAGAGAATDLGVLGNPGTAASRSGAFDINAGGTVVGFAKSHVPGELGERAARWAPGSNTAVELAVTGFGSSSTTIGRTSSAAAINDAGVVVGYSEKYDLTTRQFQGERAIRWDPAGSFTELGSLPTPPGGLNYARAAAVNGSGHAVGTVVQYDANSNSQSSAVFWGPDGAALNLNMLIDPSGPWTLMTAVGISDTDWVTGVALYDTDGPGGQIGYTRAYLIHVPEPGTALLSVTGMAALMIRRRRRGGDARGAGVARSD